VLDKDPPASHPTTRPLHWGNTCFDDLRLLTAGAPWSN